MNVYIFVKKSVKKMIYEHTGPLPGFNHTSASLSTSRNYTDTSTQRFLSGTLNLSKGNE